MRIAVPSEPTPSADGELRGRKPGPGAPATGQEQARGWGGPDCGEQSSDHCSVVAGRGTVLGLREDPFLLDSGPAVMNRSHSWRWTWTEAPGSAVTGADSHAHPSPLPGQWCCRPRWLSLSRVKHNDGHRLSALAPTRGQGQVSQLLLPPLRLLMGTWREYRQILVVPRARCI